MKTNKTISEVAALWAKEKQPYVKPSTLAAYMLAVEKHILPVFGGRHRIVESEVQAFALQKIEGGLSRKTVKDMLVVLKMVCRFGIRKGYLPRSDWSVQLPAERKQKKVAVFSIDHQRSIMQYVAGHPTPRNIGIFLCLSTGLRIGEICALKWGDIDMKEETVRIRRTIARIYVTDGRCRHTELMIGPPKTKHSVRDIPMGRDLLRLVRPMKKCMGDECYVLTNGLRPLEPRTYCNYYKRLLRSIGVPPLRFHGLRHSFATRCIESQCDYKTVSDILGHASISTTLNLYVHPNMEQKKKCIDKMFRGLK